MGGGVGGGIPHTPSPAVGIGEAWTEMEVTLDWSVLGHWPSHGLETGSSLCMNEISP